MRSWLVVAGLALAAGSTALADERTSWWSGNELNDRCNAPQSPQEVYVLHKTACFSYVIGLLDAVVMFQSNKITNDVVCTRSGMTTGQIADVVAKYLRENPAERDKAASVLVLEALHKAFPCKK